MVRKTTRAAALKASEKNRRESPRRSRRRKSTTSESSDEEVSNIIESKTTGKADSSGSDSDKESKKPLKKRTRSKALNNKKRNVKSENAVSVANVEVQPQDSEVVIEGNSSEGKSKCIDKSNSDGADTETEHQTRQVTDESPNHTSPKDDSSKNGNEITEIDVNVSESIVAEMTCDNNQSEATVEVEVSETEVIVSEPVVHADSENNTVESDGGQLPAPQEENIQPVTLPQTPEEDLQADLSQPPALEIKKPDENKSRKIKLNRITRQNTIDNTSISEPEDKETNEVGKKVNLKRIESKTEQPQEDLKVNSQAENPETEGWTSTYEANTNQVEADTKPARKRIVLKRATTDEEYGKRSKTESAEITVAVAERKESVSESKDDPENQPRRSSDCEKPANVNEERIEKAKKPGKFVKLNRQISGKEEEPLPPGETITKKFKWSRSEYIECLETIKFDDLKEVIPEVKLLDEEEVDLEIREKKPEKAKRLTFKELEEEEMESIQAELDAETRELEANQQNVIAMNRKISIVDDGVSKINPPPSPANNPVSEVLFISNLVRPFTVKQLKELLERTGKIKEDGFWTDKIKSKCYVCYETVGEAESTRNALHGIHWPIGNGKKLIIDYATSEDMEKARNPPVAVVQQKEKSPEKENKKPSAPDAKEARRDVKREWDGKGDERHKRSRSKSVDREGRKHRSYTPEAYNKKIKIEETVEQKAMDDLFLKTKATPSIYWQPLPPEEISRKQQLRQARLEENKRRMEELRSSARPPIRDRRDRNFRRR